MDALVRETPEEPVRGMIARLAARAGGEIRPDDAETRAYLGAIPVVRSADEGAILRSLAGFKGAALEDGTVAGRGPTREAALVAVSSICFVCYVKFVADALAVSRRGEKLDTETRRLLEIAFNPARRPPEALPPLTAGPFDDASSARAAIAEAGNATVALGLVDACFGNVSYRVREALHLSRSGAPLDGLEGRIDLVPLDGSGPAPRTASSELAAHRGIVEKTGARAVLHCHPRHAVVASLDCDRGACPDRGSCHLRCPYPRSAGGAPIVPGETGDGPCGSCRTLPPALAGRSAAIVHGHGVFAIGRVDFGEALAATVAVERACFDDVALRLL